MTMLRFLHRQLGGRIYLVALLSLLTGVCNTLMIKTINDVIHGGINATRIGIFTAAIAIYLLASRVFNRALLRATQRAVFEMRADILRRVLACDLTRFEQVPNQYVYTSITEDTTEVARSPEILSSLLTAGFTVLACFVYLCWLSPAAFLLILACILVGGGLYTKVAGRAAHDWEMARRTQDDFFRFVDHLLSGFKELKMNDAKRMAFFEDDLLGRCRQSYDLNVRGGEKYIQAVIVSGVLIYGVLGFFAFTGQSWLGLEAQPFAATILVMLYLTPAIQQTVDLLPTLDRFGIALNKIQRLRDDLARPQPPSMAEPAVSGHLTPARDSSSPPTEAGDVGQGDARGADEVDALGTLPPSDWRVLRLERVCFAYPAEEGAEPFQVGPIDMEVRRGETLFIVGGNGSGKTTLLKLLLGLYQPTSGRLTVDDRTWTPGSAAHRHLFAPLFADFHLFDRLYGPENGPASIGDRLKALEIDHKVEVIDGRWSTLDLSQGQRKRLGLVQAMLEPAPILVMDEFAADQDPHFRAHFYRDLLPALKAEGRTVVAITHDEAYFGHADRMVHMREGQAEEETPTAAASLVAGGLAR
ncbi:ATP-binding cassette domain-containing protein [Sulfidibacter corallicola]|uniref:ATP-binding cassette domain-containing protein n=1 Tax=Sulfidibacter corallicola TaxID=2818388 RepID=A0A8A4TI98_SULCO|nr:ATP-binding cassette domain-containing protein [Sulfidibacter corallicola]QTD48914.1 ATP-binding cassette domain-containing protein [Sulfidibacter corallicola]